MIDPRLTRVIGLEKVASDAWLHKKKLVYTQKINYNFIFIWVVDQPPKKKKNLEHLKKKKKLSPLKIKFIPSKILG